MASIHDVGGTNFAKVDQAMGAIHVSTWPQQCIGEYRFGQSTGLMTAIAANGEIAQFRWSSAARLAVVKFIRVRYAVITGFTAAQELGFDVIGSTAFSVNGTGGTAIAASATNLKKRQSYLDSLVGDLRIATTAALGAGTKTLSNASYGASAAKTLAAAATVQDAAFETTLDMTNSSDGPIVMTQNEGLSIRNSVLMGAGGTVRATIEIAWAEFDAALYPTFTP